MLLVNHISAHEGFLLENIEKESNLLKMPREFLVGGKETWKINENGLGVAYRAKLVRL